MKMSSFPIESNKGSLKPKKLVKYLIYGLILLGLTCIILNFLKNTLGQGIFGSISLLLNEITGHILNILVILIISLPTLLIILFTCKKHKIFALSFLSGYFILIITILCAFYLFGIENFSIFPLIGNLLLEFFKSLNTLLPFLILLPFLVLLYFTRLRTSSKYELTNLSIRNHILLIDDGKKKKFKALSILQFLNIPTKINVNERGGEKSHFEKFLPSKNSQYLHTHLTSLAKIIPNITFEISVLNNTIRLRLILCITDVAVDELVNKVDMLREVVTIAFKTIFPGLKFEVLRGNQLKNAWEDIIGGSGNFKFNLIDKNKIFINKVTQTTFLSILRFEKLPFFKLINDKPQIDAFIRGLMGSQFSLNYIITARPMEIDFEKQKLLIDKKVKKTREIRWDAMDKRTPENLKFRMFHHLKRMEKDIREDSHNIRNAQTGMWEVSGYVIIRSDDKDELDVDIQKISSLISTVFGVDLKILESNTLERNFPRIPMRNFLDNPMNLSSEELAILFHLPENPIPSLSRINIPTFEIPPESRISDGISIGNILLYDQEMYPIRLSIEDFRLNTFICGLIGMGKSRLTMNILQQLTEKHHEINWICLDWKGEYGYLINEIKSHKILVLTPGSNIAPLKLNMFDPQGSNSDEHARKLFAIIREVFKSEFNKQSELSSQMESVCKEVIRTVVNNPSLRNLQSFIEELKHYAREHLSENRTIMMTITALINRFDKFKHGILKEVLDVKKSNVNFDKLMEKKVVFNLNYLLTAGGAKEDVRLLMNLILKYVIDKALKRGITDTLKHLVIIEDSQFLIPAILREVPETSLVEDIPLLLRGVGESLITIATRPEISHDIIANSGVKITFKSPYDSRKIAQYQNLSDEQEHYLRIMPKREAIVTLPNFQFPFRIYTDFFDYKTLPHEDEITQNILSSNIYKQNKHDF